MSHYLDEWLEGAGLIYRCYRISTVKLPVKGYIMPGSFKIYYLDIGLLSAMGNISVNILAKGNQLFDEYKGAFIENYVAQHLKSALNMDIYYWKNENKMAEVDFICEIQNKIYPLEVKAGINPKSKSLKSYENKFQPDLLIRSTLLNLKQNGKIYNIPLYAIPILNQLYN